jgi:hypothetical protein
MISTDAKLNLYLFLGKLSIGAKCGGLSARKYKNNCAQALKETIFSDRGAKMVTQIFLAAIELEERPLPYLASLINLGVNEVAAALNAVSPALAQTFLGAKYKPGKD